PNLNSTQTNARASPPRPQLKFPPPKMTQGNPPAARPTNLEFLDGARPATGLLGDSIASNLFILAYAYQRGLVPVSAAAIEQAITLNAVEVKFNLDAFCWGRRAAVDRALVETHATAAAATPESHQLSETLDQVIERR